MIGCPLGSHPLTQSHTAFEIAARRRLRRGSTSMPLQVKAVTSPALRSPRTMHVP